MTDPIALRNRFAMVKGAWDEHLRGVPFPALGDGTAEQKIERLELALVDEMRAGRPPRPPSRPRTRCGGSCTRGQTPTRSSSASPSITRSWRGWVTPAVSGAGEARGERGAGEAGGVPAGLCDACRHQQVVRTGRGSRFSLCRRAKTDPSYPKYPRLPVRQCRGFERA